MGKQIKQERIKERIIYCSGPNWEGDGSKSTSACRFGDSMTTTTNRYKCSHCLAGRTPDEVHASANGIKNNDPIKALKEEKTVVTGRGASFAAIREGVVIESSQPPTKPKAEVAEVDLRPYQQQILKNNAEALAVAEAEVEIAVEESDLSLKPKKPRKVSRRRRF